MQEVWQGETTCDHLCQRNREWTYTLRELSERGCLGLHWKENASVTGRVSQGLVKHSEPLLRLHTSTNFKQLEDMQIL